MTTAECHDIIHTSTEESSYSTVTAQGHTKPRMGTAHGWGKTSGSLSQTSPQHRLRVTAPRDPEKGEGLLLLLDNRADGFV